jgi:hypothetical protein
MNANALAIGWTMMMVGIIFMMMTYAEMFGESYFIGLMLAVINISAGAQHFFRLGLAK